MKRARMFKYAGAVVLAVIALDLLATLATAAVATGMLRR